VAAGGRFSITGLPHREMAGMASIVLRLQRFGLVNTKLDYSQNQQPDLIPVEITDAGRQALTEEE